MTEIPKAYNPSEVEDKWSAYWESNRLYHSEPNELTPYTIVIPPPNITGMLTMGHILNNTLQDILIRYKRMQGFNACWVPGTDHASIATETKVVKYLADQGIDKRVIGRDEFLKHCYVWKDKYGGIITTQLRKLGVSCDWERERFTMDDHYYQKVVETFVNLYKEGKIYRGYRMVNWDPASQSAISDEEVLYRDVNGKLWHLKYPIKDSNDFLTVATTRPETMLGDTGVAVNPDDERYAHLIGKKVVLPIVNREIPIFADSYVDKTFGTGVVKVTPAHDPNDYEMAKRHDLEFINIFKPDASTNDNVPAEFRNLDRYDVREKVLARLQESGHLLKIEEYQTKIGYSERGQVPIEPYLSEQWFMKMDELAAPALSAVLDGKINFYPSHWTKTYAHWLEGIRDWCISRQLWWGHRIPVWYHKVTGELYCDVNPPKDIENYRQEEDVLDTWASSWLWAYDVFETEKDKEYYYPTDTLITAPDIIFFWVARMIMAGLHFKKDIPFKNVYFTSIIRDLQGRKMSKSLGNSPDPLQVIADYGADALRFSVIYQAPLGQDVRFGVDSCEFGRNFANKLWNAGRFILMNAQSIENIDEYALLEDDFVDKWMESRLHTTLQELDETLAKFDFNIAIKIVYSFVWNDFCDWYIELSKSKMYSENPQVKSSAIRKAVAIFDSLLKIVHPYMPYITEELWSLIAPRKDGESISTSTLTKYDLSKVDKNAEEEMERLIAVITAIRNVRGEMNVPPSKPVSLIMRNPNITEVSYEYVKKLSRVDEISVIETAENPDKCASTVVGTAELFIPLAGLIDVEAEKAKIEKEINRLKGSIEGIDRKLSNASFVDKAPADVVAREKEKRANFAETIEKLQAMYASLG